MLAEVIDTSVSRIRMFSCPVSMKYILYFISSYYVFYDKYNYTQSTSIISYVSLCINSWMHKCQQCNVGLMHVTKLLHFLFVWGFFRSFLHEFTQKQFDPCLTLRARGKDCVRLGKAFHINIRKTTIRRPWVRVSVFCVFECKCMCTVARHCMHSEGFPMFVEHGS